MTAQMGRDKGGGGSRGVQAIQRGVGGGGIAAWGPPTRGTKYCRNSWKEQEHGLVEVATL